MESQETAFENRVDILAQLWIEYKNDKDFQDFVEYNDIGLPLAYVVSADIVKTTDKAEMFINETFDVFLAGLGRKDEGFETLEDILGGI